jgi:hypothetical protein
MAKLIGKARIGTGNPTGSAFGKCSAQMQMLRDPDASKPQYVRPRGLMTFENGDLIEEWFKERVLLAYPNMSGLHQACFYFKVPVTPPQIKELRRRIGLRYGSKNAIWGKVIEDFQPPYLREIEVDVEVPRYLGDDYCEGPCPVCTTYGTKRHVIGKIPALDDHGQPIVDIVKKKKVQYRLASNQRIGFVLDPKAAILYAPTYIDEVVFSDEGLTVLEDKALSSFQFRRALMGVLDYGKQCQLAGIFDSVEANVSLLGYRKDTAHLVEIFYGKGEKRTRVKILRSQGKEEQEFIVDNGRLIQEIEHPEQGGAVESRVAEWPHDLEWEAAQVWVPSDPNILEDIRERILRVLLFDGKGDFWREYGPDFSCRNCQGTGTQTFRKGSRSIQLNDPKPCEECGGGYLNLDGSKAEKKAKGLTEKPGTGQLDRVQLPTFPCGYCPVVEFCWEKAGYKLEIVDNKPHHYVTRDAFQKSGIVFHPVAAAQSVPEELVPETNE